jgi:hypothetical protein
LKKKKHARPYLAELLIKKFSPWSVQPFWRESGKTFFLLLKNRFWEKLEILRSFFPTLFHYSLDCREGHMKENAFVCMYVEESKKHCLEKGQRSKKYDLE